MPFLALGDISPPIKISRLKNGLPLIVHPFPGPAIGLTFMVGCGPVYESAKNNGISHFLEHMLFRGTPEFPSSEKLGMALDRVGAESNAATFSDMTVISHKVLPESLETALNLLKGMITQPVFEGIEAERQIILEECLEDIDEDGKVIAMDQLSSQLLFGHHPYSYSILGSVDLIKNVTPAELATHLRKHYRPSRSVLCLSGNVPAAKTKKLVESVFGTWTDPKPESALPVIGEAPIFQGPKLLSVDSSRSQVNCRLSFRALSFCNPSYYLLDALVRLLDSGSGSPIRKVLQDELGFCYSLGAGVDSYEASGAIHIDFTVHPDHVIEAVKRSLEAIAQLIRDGIPQDGLDHMIRQYIKGKRFASHDLWDFSSRYGFHVLFPGSCPLETEFELVQKMNSKKLETMARKIFTRSNFGLTLVGSVSRTMVTKARRLIEDFPL